MLIRTGFRLGQTLTSFAPLLWHSYRKRALDPARLRKTCEQLGATYIKLGQFIASTPSLFPPAYVTAFQNCLDQVAPLPFSVIQKSLKRELNRPPAECFAEIEPKPLASASIAQVHAARLIDGTQVVLKVQRPGVLKTLRADLFIIRLLVRIAQAVRPGLRRAHFLKIGQEMEKRFREECNFLREADRLKRFRSFLTKSRVKIVTAPQVYDDLTTTRLLVMERLTGQPVNHATLKEFSGPDPFAALQLAFQVWLMSITECDFFHADVHGGNLLLLPSGGIGIIDFGLCDSIAKEDWQAAIASINALRTRNVPQLAASMVRLGVVGKEVDQQQLTSQLTQALAKAWSGQSLAPQASPQNVSIMLADFRRIAEANDLQFPDSFFLLLRQYFYFEGFLRLARTHHLR